MKKITILLFLSAMASMLFTASVIYKRHSSVSDTYTNYVGCPELDVAFIKDYRINDTLTVDVTTITANDSASWENLLKEMNLMEEQIELSRISYNAGRQFVGHYYCIKNHPEHPIYRPIEEYSEFDCVVYVQHLKNTDRTLYIFDVASVEEGRIISHTKRDEIN